MRLLTAKRRDFLFTCLDKYSKLFEYNESKIYVLYGCMEGNHA